MNTARCMTAFMLVYAASFAARADSDSSLPEHSTPSSSLYDPDAQIKNALAKSQSSRASMVAAEKQRQTRNQETSDWLLRSYEEQLRGHNTDPSRDEKTNVYYEIGNDRNLSKLAGITVFDLNSSAETMNVHMTMTNPGKDALTLRPDSPSSPGSAGQSPSGKNFTPFFKPVASTTTGFASLHNSYATPSSGLHQFLPKGDSPVITPPPPSYAYLDNDPAAIETPGMIAAESNPLPDRNASTFSLDRLPGESISEARAHRENLTLIELPQTTDVSRLEKLRDTATRPPGTKLAPPVPISPALLKFQEEPLVTAPPPSPIRTPVNDPRDMTFR